MIPVHCATPRRSQYVTNSLFNEFFNNIFEDSNTASPLAPRLNLREDDKTIYVSVELPGVDKKDVDISLKDNVLVIKGEKKHSADVKKEDYSRIERSYGSFKRAIQLSNNVDEKGITANLKDGVLELTLPKTEKDSTQIAIN